MSALPPKADIAERDQRVRFVPKADIVIFYRGVAPADFKPKRAQSLGTLSKSVSNLPIYRDLRLARRLRNAESPICFLI
jgi:hypothetical protein